jgi:hypothetical protein
MSSIQINSRKEAQQYTFRWEEIGQQMGGATEWALVDTKTGEAYLRGSKGWLEEKIKRQELEVFCSNST